MEPANRPPVGRRPGRDGTAVDFLPDADEIERSPLPRAAQFTLHALFAALAAFLA